MMKSEAPDKSGDVDGAEDDEEEEGEEMEVDAPGEADAVARARAAARALGKGQGSKGFMGSQDVTELLQELNMDQYDEEGDDIELFGSGIGDAYYASNELDPYLLDKDDEDDEEIEDLNIKPTDGVIVCAHNEEDTNQLEVLIFEETEDGEPNMYIHHEILLPAYPLCLAWTDCNLKTGEKGNFIAVGSMEPAIEIWDLDVVDEVEPFIALGGVSNKKKKKKKEDKVKFKKGSHKDAVLGLSWNKEFRNVLASASADKSVKIWDVVTGNCVSTLKHHSDKVQAVTWNPHQHSPELLLSGSFDRAVVMMDVKSNTLVNKWSVDADVESLAWNPHEEHCFVVSLENGVVQGLDKRVASNASSVQRPRFTLHAHDKAVCSVSYNPSAKNLLATGSMDKMVKLWDLSNDKPSCVASRNPKAGRIFSLSFYRDSPFLLAIGGGKGKLQVWDTMTEAAIESKYGNPANADGKIPPTSEA